MAEVTIQPVSRVGFPGSRLTFRVSGAGPGATYQLRACDAAGGLVAQLGDPVSGANGDKVLKVVVPNRPSLA